MTIIVLHCSVCTRKSSLCLIHESVRQNVRKGCWKWRSSQKSNYNLSSLCALSRPSFIVLANFHSIKFSYIRCCLDFRIPSQGNAWLERGRESRLVIDNVTYDYQGEYECRASNFINGQERSTTSDPISLQVVGAPQVLRPNSSGYQVAVKRGESASLTLVVCADPRPRHVAWEWGSLRLEAGAGIGEIDRDKYV